MSLYKTHFKELCPDVTLTPDEEAQMAKVATQIALGTEEEAHRKIAYIFTQMPEAAMRKAAAAMLYYQKHAATGAGGTLGGAPGWPTVVTTIATALTALPALQSILGHVGGAFSRVGILDQVKREHPDLAGDPNLQRYYDLIVHFAPAVASNALLLGNTLVAMHRVGPENVTPATLMQLLEFSDKQQGVRSGLPHDLQELGQNYLKHRKAIHGWDAAEAAAKAQAAASKGKGGTGGGGTGGGGGGGGTSGGIGRAPAGWGGRP